jgi:ABC-type antimicrobial peptide transport system permease subunit
MSLLVTFAGVIASLYPARRAGKLNVLKAIATE